MASQLDLHTKPRARGALFLARNHHQGIERKYNGGPYINHPIAVAERLVAAGWGHNENVICAALLHDCLEDPNAAGEKMTPEAIFQSCGGIVARWVQLLTKPTGHTRAWRNDRYTRTLAAAPLEVQAIKLADILDNVTGIAALDPEFAPTYLDEKEAQVKAMSPRGGGGTNLRAAAFNAIVVERNQLAVQTLHMMQRLEASRIEEEAEIERMLRAENDGSYADFALF